MSELLQTIEIEPQAPATASVIWLHGLGADGHDFEPIVPELGLPQDMAVRFVFPHAPVRPVSLNGNMPMRAWFDIRGLDANAQEDVAGIVESSERVRALIEREEQRGIASDRIVLAGFSQGGAIALHLGLRYPTCLAGILALSTWLPLRTQLAEQASPANLRTPIFMAHGSLDPVVPCSLGEMSRDLLQAHGHPVKWAAYPMQHQVCQQQIAEIGQWLQKLLA